MKRITLTHIFSFILSWSSVSAQAKLDGQFFEYTTYYMSNIDLQTGVSDVPFFRHRIYSDKYPVFVKVWFRASILSPALNINTRTTLIELEMDPVEIKESVVIDNRNFSTVTSTLLDEANPPNIISVNIQSKASMKISEFESMISNLLVTGQLAPGEYRFELKLYSGSSEADLSLSDQDSKSMIVESPSGINLESPGGALADTSFNVVYTTYPIFNWSKGSCRNCETYIRVAEFKVGYHSSTEEAIRDERMLPFNQSDLWMRLDDVSTYQYPISGARNLEYGKIYVWQIKARVPTTSGMKDEVSSIYSFKIANPSQSTTPATEDLILEQLRQAIGDDQFNAIFGPGSALEGFKSTGKISLNNTNIDKNTLQQILSQLAKKNLTINSVRVD